METVIKKYERWILLGILVAAFSLCIWNIGSRDVIGDEATYSFRSIGYLDYLGTSAQTEPVDWYAHSPLPWWTRLSFHDAPPLSFAIQHVFFRLFGDSIFVSHLPAVLFGAAAPYLVYLIVGALLPESPLAALFAALFFAVGGAAVGIFRTTLIEPTLFFFVLLNVYFFLRYAADRRFWWPFGLTLGLAMLAKYTAVFLAPAYLLYALAKRRSVFGDWRLYASGFLAAAVFSPVIVYNIELYLSRGHFDLQFAYLFGQSTPEWQGLLGKVQAPFSSIFSHLYGYYGPLALALAAAGGVLLWFRKERRGSGGAWFLFSYALAATLLFAKIGAADRFIVLYALPFAALSGIAAERILAAGSGRWKAAAALTLALLAFLELSRSIRVDILGEDDIGVAKLDQYLSAVMAGKVSAVLPESDNPHLNEVIDAFSKRRRSGTPAFLMIVYNDNVALSTLEWIFYRRFFYEGIPVLYVQNFEKLLASRGPGYFKGFDLYFVQSTPHTLLDPFKTGEKAGDQFELELLASGGKPVAIRGENGLEMFRVYEFSVGATPSGGGSARKM